MSKGGTTLPVTGRCHYCGSEVENRRFCNTSCNDKYNVRKRRQREGYRREQQRFTAKRLTPEQLEANINSVVQKAIKRGDYYGMAQLAPQEATR